MSLLTGGGDRPYVHGLTNALASDGISVDLIGGDELDSPEFRDLPNVRFLNLRGDQGRAAPLAQKVRRIVSYYARLIRYAWTAETTIFHILWNNRFETF